MSTLYTVYTMGVVGQTVLARSLGSIYCLQPTVCETKLRDKNKFTKDNFLSHGPPLHFYTTTNLSELIQSCRNSFAIQMNSQSVQHIEFVTNCWWRQKISWIRKCVLSSNLSYCVDMYLVPFFFSLLQIGCSKYC